MFLFKARSRSLREQRRYRHEMILFFHSLSLYLVAGYDFNSSWELVSESLLRGMSRPLRDCLKISQGGVLSDVFRSVQVSFPIQGIRPWLGVLGQFYENGTELVSAIRQLTELLEAEQAMDMENHQRCLPTRLNLILIVFFLPPALMLLMTPLVLGVWETLLD